MNRNWEDTGCVTPSLSTPMCCGRISAGRCAFFVSCPAFPLTVIAVIALGIGVNTATFALLDHVLLRPLPFAPDRLVSLHETRLKQGVVRNATTPPDFLEWRAMSSSFDAIGAYFASPLSVNLSGPGDPIRLDSSLISAEAFRALGIRATAGCVILADDEKFDAPNVVLLSNSAGAFLFGTAPAAVGRTVNLDDVEHTIVMPPGFAFPSRGVELWRPLRFSPDLIATVTLYMAWRACGGGSPSKRRERKWM